jgi:hypothetical protein
VRFLFLTGVFHPRKSHPVYRHQYNRLIRRVLAVHFPRYLVEM